LYTYFLAYHMSPSDTWWEHSVPDLRYLQIAAIIALATTLMLKELEPEEGFLKQGGVRLVLVFNLWIWLVTLWAIAPLHVPGCVVFLKHFLVMFVVYRLAKVEVAMVKNIFLSIVIGTGWFGWITMGKGGRVENVAGAISDANSFGMYSSAALMLTAVMVLGFKGNYRLVPFACSPLIVNNLVLSGSRGAFLATVLGGVVLWLYCPRVLRHRFKVFAALGVVLFLMLAHEQLLERIRAMFEAAEGTKKVDNSAASRVEIAEAGWLMALDYPLGAGTRATAYLSPRYMRKELLTRDKDGNKHAARAAHNSFMDALVSYGFPGFFMYLGMFIWGLRATRKIRNAAVAAGDIETALLASGLAAAIAVAFTAGQFTSFLDFENQFWMFAMTAAMLTIQRRQAREDARAQRREEFAMERHALAGR